MTSNTQPKAFVFNHFLLKINRKKLFKLMVLVLSFSLTVIFWYISVLNIKEKKLNQFNTEVKEIETRLFDYFAKYEYVLKASSVLIKSHKNEFLYPEWVEFVDELNIKQQYPAINGIGVIDYVLPNNLSTYLHIQNINRPYFNIHPKISNDFFLPITFIEPHSLNKRLVGLDISSNKNWLSTALLARDSGKPYITAPTNLIDNDNDNDSFGFMLLMPLYNKTNLLLINQRKQDLIGFTYIAFKMSSFTEVVFNKNRHNALMKSHVLIEISDNNNILYSEKDYLNKQYDPHPLYHKNIKVNLYGRIWNFNISSTKSFRKESYSNNPAIILIVGSIINLMVAMIFYSICKSEGIAQDIASEKSKTLMEREAELNLIFNNIPASALYKDDNNTIIRINKYAATLMGGNVEDFEGKNMSDVFPNSAKEYHENDLEIMNSDKAVLNMVKKISISNLPDRWLSIDKIPFVNPINDNRRILIITRDVTVQKESEISLRQSNEQLTEFAHIASHDLKEPLRGINNHAKFLLEDFADELNDEVKRKIDRISFLAVSMQELITALLDYAQLSVEDKKPVYTDCNKLVDDIIETINANDDKNIKIIKKNKLPMILGQPVKIKALFRNLINNGLKYNESKIKMVTIGIDKSLSKQFSKDIFYVKDNGIGIPEEQYKNVFRIFKRLHKKGSYGGGTGSGLTFVKKIIDSMDGKIWISSKLNKSTIFYFNFNIKRETDEK